MIFFSEFYCPGRVWAEFGTKFFLSISQPISSVLAKNNASKRFFHFLNFFAIFFGIFFLGQSNPNLAKNTARKIFFLISEFFCNFFRNFLARVEYERNSRQKFFSPFLVLSHLVLAKNNAGKRCFNFLTFYAILFGIFLPGSSMNGIRD